MVLVCGPATILFGQSPAKSLGTSSVGIPQRIDQIVLPGTELEVKPIADRDAPLVLRIVASYPHGTAFRYDLEYYGLESGKYDLREYLRRKDATPAADLPELPITIVSVLPAGQILPTDLIPQRSPWFGGYRLLLALVLLGWLTGFIALLFVGRRRKRAALAAAARPMALAERLQPLVESAITGRLSPTQQAELERLLLGYWSKRLEHEDLDPAEAIRRLRSHEVAGELLRQVEAWLHQPGGAKNVDLEAVLGPYRRLAAPNSPFASELVEEGAAR